MKMRPKILRTGRKRGEGDGAFIESSSAGAGRDGDWMRGQRIALKLRAQRLRAHGGGTGEREAGQRGNAILPTRAPGSFKRLLDRAAREIVADRAEAESYDAEHYTAIVHRTHDRVQR